MNPKYKPNLLATAIMLAFSAPTAVFAQATEISLDEAAAQDAGGTQAAAGSTALELSETRVIGTAEEELKQASGVSVITAEDIQRRPAANDLSEIIRRMPGVNLTGNSASGQFGNSRQIDLRGMGPENTLIMIDGKPVSSRNSVRMGRSGERNGRGDSNWVPAEAVERIEVLRGPAAARYGSGAAGGVVNIITKAPGKTTTGSVTAYTNIPENSDEGSTRRLSFNAAGPLSDSLSYRVYGNFNKTDSDEFAVNDEYASGTNPPPAGREGVRNKDIDALLRWDITDEQTLEFEGGFSRQGNIYAGERAQDHPSTVDNTTGLIGRETNTMYRQTASVTHRGDWEFGTSKVGLTYENSRNRRLPEGLAGGPETGINGSKKSTSEYESYRLNGELNLPLELVFDQVLTIGAEYTRDELNDPYSNSQGTSSNGVDLDLQSEGRSGKADADNYALFIEDNIELTPDWTLTPGLRFDHNSIFGNNWSPSLNSSYKLTDTITLKGGVAKAFKAPNLYQSNPNYLYFTMGNGCPDGFSQGGGCYILGNENLDAETSINKELGIAFADAGWAAGMTYFHNDYKDKIIAGMGDGSPPISSVPGSGTNIANVYQWENAPKAVVSGWEGNLSIPLLGSHGETLSWNTNFTYMIQNKNKSNGEPLSVIPKYTVNSMLDWTVTEALDLSLTVTHFGKQEPRRLTTVGNAAEGDALNDRDPYTLVGLGANYELTKNWRFAAGVSNLFDKQLRRESISGGQGANNYNEPGRAFYVSTTASF